jgi:hypothetical protein
LRRRGEREAHAFVDVDNISIFTASVVRASRFLPAAFVLTLLALAILVALHLTGAPSGDFVDWVVGIAGVWWLMLITTVPWSLYFDARAAQTDAAASRQRGIAVDADKLRRIERLAGRALIGAIALHVATAAGLYAVAAWGLSPVGYPGAGLALALSVARPSARGYRYLAAQIGAFRKEVHFPREDVVRLRTRFDKLEALLDLEREDAWAAQIQRRLLEAESDLARLIERYRGLSASNQAEHERLEREYRTALATVTEDRRFVEHLREIVRFVRSA